eukprot:Unigene13715_Nuclearia_a/m.41458 Unigene13715_Nuclearia_a/g.41458  ORF Unigene13715_Nuclearia_a/g.41458 Unigene13715_Nuclearia_a/m.41458 type:complete len:303 (+) Unigene13715_Nuclearia_a:154-1062(+)
MPGSVGSSGMAGSDVSDARLGSPGSRNGAATSCPLVVSGSGCGDGAGDGAGDGSGAWLAGTAGLRKAGLLVGAAWPLFCCCCCCATYRSTRSESSRSCARSASMITRSSCIRSGPGGRPRRFLSWPSYSIRTNLGMLIALRSVSGGSESALARAIDGLMGMILRCGVLPDGGRSITTCSCDGSSRVDRDGGGGGTGDGASARCDRCVVRPVCDGRIDDDSSRDVWNVPVRTLPACARSGSGTLARPAGRVVARVTCRVSDRSGDSLAGKGCGFTRLGCPFGAGSYTASGPSRLTRHCGTHSL